MLERKSLQPVEDWRFRFENEEWSAIKTPHSWNALDTMQLDTANGWYKRGVGLYETEIETTADERTFIRFGAASQKAIVYWNGAEIGRNAGGYLPFTVELPSNSHGTLSVAVDNSPDIDLPPSDRSDFFLYGGLTRAVTRYTTAEQQIAQLHIEPQLAGDTGHLHLVVNVDGATNSVRCLIHITDPHGEEIVHHEEAIDSAQHTLTLPPFQNPWRWSPDTPHLYTIHLALWQQEHLSDEVTSHFGWRTFDFPAGGPLYLNGERLLLKGTHRHEDWAGCASAVSEANTRAEFKNMKAAGMNFIRLGHYPQSHYVYNLCNELGLIVWDELPWCRGGVGGDLFKEQTRQMLHTMIAEHRHHPSIIFWGMGNELDWEYDHEEYTDDDVFAFLVEINALAHQLDPSRLTALRRYERGAAVVDVYSPSIWSGWYRGRYQDYEWALTDAQQKYPRMLHIEWSADNHIGRHNVGPHLPFELERERDHSEQDGLAYSAAGFARASRDGDWSESYFLDLAAWTLRIQKNQPNFAGAAQWAFKDFGTPLRPENPIPYVNQKGIVDRANRPKTAFYLFQAAQTETPVCHIEAHSWPVRVGDPNKAQRVRVITNCESVELFLNGVSQGVCAGKPDDWLRVWHLQLPEGENSFQAKGTTADGRLIEDAMSQTFVAATNEPPTHWQADVEDQGGEVRLTIQQCAANGRPVATPEQCVTFGVEGDGRLLIDQGTIDGSRTIATANGRASIVVQKASITKTYVTVICNLLPVTRLKV